MKKSFYVQDELQETYKNLLDLIPDQLKNDPHTQKVILVYLKLGGFKLARHAIEVIKKRLREDAYDNSAESKVTRASLDDNVDITEPHPHELGGFEFPVE